MAAVRNVASNGRTVMVTIHQPSIEIFESFDRLVLLGMGGESIYVGPLGHESRRLVDYFEVRCCCFGPHAANVPSLVAPSNYDCLRLTAACCQL